MVVYYVYIDQRRQRARDSLQRFRDVGRPFETHNSTTMFWSTLPYPINALTWFVYYRLLDNMVRRTGTRVPLYIHGTVLLPFSVISYDLVRSHSIVHGEYPLYGAAMFYWYQVSILVCLHHSGWRSCRVPGT